MTQVNYLCLRSYARPELFNDFFFGVNRQGNGLMGIFCAYFIADKIPALHKPLQSLGRDRVKEILPSRWVVDGSDFQRDFSWKSQATLHETLQQTAAWNISKNFEYS